MFLQSINHVTVSQQPHIFKIQIADTNTNTDANTKMSGAISVFILSKKEYYDTGSVAAAAGSGAFLSWISMCCRRLMSEV